MNNKFIYFIILLLMGTNLSKAQEEAVEEVIPVEEGVVGAGQTIQERIKEENLFEVNGLYFKILTDEVLMIVRTDYSELTRLNIPNSIEYNNHIYDVIWIENGCFENCQKLESVICSNDNCDITNSVFKNCISLTEIQLPSKLKRIGDEAFKGCKLLKSINFPNSMTSIGDRAFEACTSLENIKFPSQEFFYIGSFAFMDCKSIKQLNLSGFKDLSIGTGSFYNCKNLELVYCPSKFSINFNFGGKVFENCENLSTVFLFNRIKESDLKFLFGNSYSHVSFRYR